MILNYKLLGFTSICTISIGIAISGLIINSENGYVGSMVFLPLFLLLLIAGFILFIISIIGFASEKTNLGVCLLISAFLLPTSFIGSCLTAKYFEIGAYRQEPMIPFPISTNFVTQENFS